MAKQKPGSPLPDSIGWFWNSLHTSCLSEQLQGVWFELLSPYSSHQAFRFEITDLCVLRKQSHGLWNPAISLAPYQLHVLPLETGSSIRGEKCKWNVCPFFFFSLECREISGVEESSVCVICFLSTCLSLWITKQIAINSDKNKYLLM